MQICVFLPTVGEVSANLYTLIHANLEPQTPSLPLTHHIYLEDEAHLVRPRVDLALVEAAVPLHHGVDGQLPVVRVAALGAVRDPHPLVGGEGEAARGQDHGVPPLPNPRHL